MVTVDSYPIAVALCVVTMLCWGSWANTQKLAAANWRFELFYWDYVIGILLTSLLFALTLGSMGNGGRSFIADLQQGSLANIGSALAGGGIFNIANILLVAAIAIAGMSVAFPVAIGLALVTGVIVNYIDSPVGNTFFIFGGVALIVVAILLNASAYRKKLAGGLKVSRKGLEISIISGLLMGLFYKYVARAMFPDFNHPEAGKLSPYTAVFLFSVGIFLSNFILNTLLMRKPLMGGRVTYGDYFRGSARNHLMGVFGGLVWCIGMSFNIIASGLAGPAISYGLGQGATIIAAIWGIFIWKEFKDAPKGTNTLLAIMLLCYIAGLVLLIAAK
jgi:glucose uptake protein